MCTGRGPANGQPDTWTAWAPIPTLLIMDPNPPSNTPFRLDHPRFALCSLGKTWRSHEGSHRRGGALQTPKEGYTYRRMGSRLNRTRCPPDSGSRISGGVR